MSVLNLQIDEILKLKLTSLMTDFNSHRILNIALPVHKEEIVINEPIEVKEENKKESFFHKFFFSEY